MNPRPSASIRVTAISFVCCTAFHLPTSELSQVFAAEQTLQVSPSQITFDSVLDRVQLLVRPADQPHDLTRQARLESTTPQIVQVTDRGTVIPLQAGQGNLRITVGGQTIDVPVTIPETALQQTAAFATDIMPILNKTGCTSGPCHASQHGKGDLKLSLLGFAPEQDHPALVRDRQQRRISVLKPDDSLLLKKATLAVSHGGGMRFKNSSWEYDVLRRWIAEGAVGPAKDEANVVGLEINPTNRVYNIDEQQQLQVVATYEDGRRRDVTQAAIYNSLGDSIATVDDAGLISVIGRGQAAIMIRYQGQATVSHVLSPFRNEVDLSDFEPLTEVDRLVRDHWKRLKVQPSPTCSDEHFIRRAFLDSVGTLPTPERVQSFVNNDAPDKRAELVDELLGLTGDADRDIYGNEWSAWWTLKWGDLLRINRNDLGDGGMWSFANWVRASLRENKPMDQFVREIITAQGSIYQNGPANYFKTAKTPTDLAETTAQVFLGVRLQCAKCHHHPFEVYSQADYYGLAAFFTRVGNKASTDFGALGADTVVKINPSGSIRHPRTRQVMQPTPLLKEPVDPAAVRDLRRPLAEWLTSPDNDLFAKNIVNRIWGYYMGYGLVEPIDDLRATNPASNPELLDYLAKDFVSSGFDLKHLMKQIMTSRVYQLDARPRPENAAIGHLYVHYNVKRMPAEALLDAIDFACGTQEKFGGVPLGTRAIELPDPNYTSYFLDTLGRPQRVIACECERTAQPNLAQVLHIANGEVVNRKLADKNGRLTRLEKQDDDDAIDELYLVTLSRRPTKVEQQAAREVISGTKTRREGLENLLWALLNSREFLFVH